MTVAALVLLAGLMGAAGIVLAAAGAHATTGAGLEGAAYMLLFHATAILGGAALYGQALLWRPALLLAMAGWVVGAILFSSDVTLRAFAGQRLFPMAAPAGGTILIGAWLALAAAAITGMMRS